LEKFAHDVDGGRELIIALEECALGIAGMANQLYVGHESRSAVVTPGAKLQTQPVTLPDFPRIWRLFGFLLPRKIRQEVFEPTPEEMKEDYLVALRPLLTRLEARWLIFCFSIRTLVIVCQSLRAALGDRGARSLRCAASGIFGAGAFRILQSLWQTMWRK
jgi:hypothetical protein